MDTNETLPDVSGYEKELETLRKKWPDEHGQYPLDYEEAVSYTHLFVDFGIYEVCREKAMDFANGYERSFILDFNVVGDITAVSYTHLDVYKRQP